MRRAVVGVWFGLIVCLEWLGRQVENAPVVWVVVAGAYGSVVTWLAMR